MRATVMVPVAVQAGASAAIEADGDGARVEAGIADADGDARAGERDGVVIEAELGADAQAATSRPATIVVAIVKGDVRIEAFSG